MSLTRFTRAVGVPPELPAEAYTMPPGEVVTFVEKRARAELDKLARELPAELNGGVHVTIGTPWDAICRAAKNENVDLIFREPPTQKGGA